jgi:hypothetical protein
MPGSVSGRNLCGCSVFVKALDWLNINYGLILGALSIGFLTEIIISTANHAYG